jgi:hypothetical protein
MEVLPAFRARLRTAWSKECGATSMTTAPAGTFLSASWNRTGEEKLLTLYAAEEYLASSLSQFSSGTLDEIHLWLQAYGEVTTFSRASLSLPAICCMK